MTEGDVDELERLLAEDVELHGDGGGKAPALSRALSESAWSPEPWLPGVPSDGGRTAASNGPKSMASPERSSHSSEGLLISAMSLEIVDGRVRAIYSVINPEKLGPPRRGRRRQGDVDAAGRKTDSGGGGGAGEGRHRLYPG